MSYITYKQADSRWGKKNYNGSSSMATAGCGPTSVAMLAYAVDGKTNPWDVAKFMQRNGYAIRNNGTAWSGIPAAMKHFGLKDVKNVNVDKSMSEVWDYLSKGYCAVFLFRGGSRGGVCWTTGGHYVAVTDYKVQNGKHYLYTRDSGGRNHTGWYAYETTMRGLIPKVWVGKIDNAKPSPAPAPKPKPTPAPKPAPKNKTVTCIDVSEHQGKIDWKKVKASGIKYAIIRVGYGKNNIDKRFKENIIGAIKAGLSVSGYWFSYAYNDSMVTNEAKYCAAALNPYKTQIDMPVFFDFEYDSMNYCKRHNVHPSKATLTKWHELFCEEIKKAGYKAGYYYNYDYKKNHLDLSKLPYYKWYALYDKSDKQTDCYMQQYSSKGKVNGISGNVDMNWIFWAEPSPAPKPPKDNELKEDGYMGPATIKGIQKWLGRKLTGVMSKADVKALQKKVGAKVDGVWGKGTTKALQKFLNKAGYKLKEDGIIGTKTIKALQNYLNKNVMK